VLCQQFHLKWTSRRCTGRRLQRAERQRRWRAKLMERRTWTSVGSRSLLTTNCNELFIIEVSVPSPKFLLRRDTAINSSVLFLCCCRPTCYFWGVRTVPLVRGRKYCRIPGRSYYVQLIFNFCLRRVTAILCYCTCFWGARIVWGSNYRRIGLFIFN